MGFGFKILTQIVRVFALCLALLPLGVQAGDCDASHLDLRGDWGQVRFTVEIADTVAERAQGLMNRDEMATMAGMLFVYERPQAVSFWMKNTLIPLDMIFIDETGLVKTIHENAVPLDTTPIPGGERIKYVLEINGGLVGALGITVDSEIKQGEIDQKIALWPCLTN